MGSWIYSRKVDRSSKKNLYMAPGTDAVACLGKLENGFCKEHEKDPIFNKKPHEVYDDSAQSKASRPPLMRHCSSHATLADPFSTVN